MFRGAGTLERGKGLSNPDPDWMFWGAGTLERRKGLSNPDSDWMFRGAWTLNFEWLKPTRSMYRTAAAATLTRATFVVVLNSEVRDLSAFCLCNTRVNRNGTA